MYSINRCPRCGAHRILKQRAQEILVLCAGCGLTTTELELPPPPGVAYIGSDLEPILKRQRCMPELPVCRAQLTLMRRP